jgi:CheY-like chemotaxis protein
MKRQIFTILLVDDDEMDLMFIEKAFRSIGVKDPIQQARDGAEAVAYLKGEGKFADREKYEFPSMIMIDLKMPRENGFHVLEVVKNHPHWSIIPHVVLSASSDEDDIKKSYMLGAMSYLVKPAEPKDLKELLKKFHEYWELCEVPRVDESGRQLRTESFGRSGERFAEI